MKTSAELSQVSKSRMQCFDEIVDGAIDTLYYEIQNLLAGSFLDKRDKMIDRLMFHLKHMAFLCAYDSSESLAEIVSKVSADMQILNKGKMKTIHDLSDDEWDQYLDKIKTLFYEEICK